MWRDERGMALVLVLLCATLFLALSGALVTVVSTESAVSATFREGAAALSAAEAAAIRTFADLAVATDLNPVLGGSVASSFRDGPAAAPRRLPDGTMLDLAAATNLERCGAATCTEDQMNAVTPERPWGANNARWQLYASGWLRDVVPQPIEAPNLYVVVWVGDDPLETDGNPLADAADVHAPGHDAVLLRAAAYGAYSVRRRIEIVARRWDGVVRLASWRELR
jgi:hypothetical protein